MSSPPATSNKQERTLVLAFDGSGNQFSENNTNVVKFCSALKLDDPEKQMVFYQPGIGTYTDPSISIKGILHTKIAKGLDLAFAWYLNAHILGGYRFLMENYKPGDRICMVGFSRGSYTARALAVMLQTVGLLYKDNIEQVEFAYGLYVKRHPLRKTFKKTFSRDVKVEFMGLWDTVGSVGLLISQKLPVTSKKTIKVFRHAISLDERRSKFNVVLWDPRKESLCPDSTRTDNHIEGVLEMWFVGAHSDIGGSSVNDDEPHSLGHITFRWMMQEIDRSGCGILFDYHSLRDLGIPPDSVPTPSKMHYHAAAGSHSIIPSPKVAPDNESSTSSSSSQHQNEGAGCLSFFRTLKYKLMKYNTKPKETLPEQASKPCAELDEIDVLERINDELSKHPFFWRMFQTPRWYPGSIFLDFSGKRRFPTDKALIAHQQIHRSVAIRAASKAPGVTPYVPKAKLPTNWMDFVT